MFEIGFTEILLILGIALLVLGPEKLPKLAADVGRWAGRARAMARQLRTQLEPETQFSPLSGINTDLDSKSSGATTNSIHTPPPPAPAAEDDASRAAPTQVADSAPATTTTADPVSATNVSSPDPNSPAAQDGR